MIYKKMQKSY
ncbi:hypothetical protein Mgra_00004243 [Meloidogyne graminicola]|uniref:Uncharacterized protein n=1 Tax=Meloidogyne graminicola TaxID=189291 RepID=A0A8S9ZSN0_9BILA|nr:hypothetical protein Mgra_00004243 [Meloidogyne graminicola]